MAFDVNKRCMGCMRKIKEGETVCPVCGRRHSDNDQPEGALPLGATLHDGKYMVGKVMGRGGFGMTYIGLEEHPVLELKVAIKEFFPLNSATREPGGQTVYLQTGSTQVWNMGRESFVKEARNMDKINQLPSVVHVKDVFYQNNTAYIVMDYIEGDTLKNKLSQKGLMSVDECVSLLSPIMTALGNAHAMNLIHRDVSPDNIMVDKLGHPWLLDMGAAKEASAGGAGQNNPRVNPTTHLVVRHGFSPPEQYSESGKIGPWTDVYAMCVTIIYCITGKVIPDAMSRMEAGELSLPSSIPPAVAEALRHGLQLRIDERTQSMEQLMKELQGAIVPPAPPPQPPTPPTPPPAPKPKWKLIAGIGAGVVAVAALVLVLLLSNKEVDPFKYTLHSDSVESSGYEGKEELLSIPASHEDRPVTEISDRAFEGAEGLLDVSIPEGVTRIGERAFADCVSLERVSLPQSLVEISASAFSGCAALKEISLPQGLARIGDQAFAGCAALSSLTVPEGVTRLGTGAFSGCSGLSGVTLPGMSLPASLLRDCSGLARIDIPEGAVEIGVSALEGCSALKLITIPESLTSIGERAFANCASLEEITIPESVQRIAADAFSGCGSLREAAVSIKTQVADGAFPEQTVLTRGIPWAENLMASDVCDKLDEEAFTQRVFGTELLRNQIQSVTFLSTTESAPSEGRIDISANFDGSVLLWWERYGGGGNDIFDLYIAADGGVSAPADCTGLFNGYQYVKSIDFGDAFHTETATNMKNMFYQCGELVRMDVSGFDTSGVTNMRGLFNGCAKLSKLDVSGFDTSSVTDFSFTFDHCSSVTELDLRSFDTSQATSLSTMFQSCSSLKRILGIENFDTAKVTRMDYLFNDTPALESLDVSGFRTSNVTDMRCMFRNCGSLQELDLSGFNTSKVTTMRSMFSGCEGLSELDLSSFNTSRVTDMGFMFNGCSGLEELDLSGFDTSSATDLTTMFQLCSGLKRLDVSNFSTGRVTAMDFMFYGCSSLETLDISSFDTSNVTTFRRMFRGCSSLTNLVRGNGFVISRDANTEEMYYGTTLS